jgi:hypothetical protein
MDSNPIFILRLTFSKDIKLDGLFHAEQKRKSSWLLSCVPKNRGLLHEVPKTFPDSGISNYLYIFGAVIRNSERYF